MRNVLLSLALVLVGTNLALAQITSLSELTKTIEKIKKTSDDSARVAKGAAGLSLQEEIDIGDAVAIAIVVRYGGIWRDEPATVRVNMIGRVLAQFATRQDLNWRFGLLNSDAINAFSAPGGRVFITRGLYGLLLSDDELAGVLAHEIIHIDQRHAIDIIARGEFLGGASSLAADNSDRFAAYESIVGETESLILDKGFDAGVEYEADESGRDLSAVTGFEPGGLRAVLIQIDDSNEESSEVFSTHPSTKKRLKRLPDDPLPPKPEEPQITSQIATVSSPSAGGSNTSELASSINSPWR